MASSDEDPVTMEVPAAVYDVLATGVALIDRSDRARLEVSGPERAKFLHNLTTNDVKRLAVGQGHESFVTSPQGKTLGYVTLLACDDRILVRADPVGLAAVLPQFQKYGVFDDVTLDDVAARTFELHVVGARSEELVRRAGGEIPPDGELHHVSARIGNFAVRAIRESPTGRPGLTLIGDAAGAADVISPLRGLGAEHGLIDL